MEINFEWDTSPEQAFIPMTEQLIIRIKTAVYDLMQFFAIEIEQWMKLNAQWTDRTGNLRQSLWATAQRMGSDAVTLMFDYGLDYGFFLEYANQGRYAIIAPALDYFLPRIWKAIRSLLGHV